MESNINRYDVSFEMIVLCVLFSSFLGYNVLYKLREKSTFFFLHDVLLQSLT